MKRKILTAIIIFSALGAGAVANVGGWSFFAPDVADKDAFSTATEGDIVYDQSEDAFYGRTNSGWDQFGGAVALAIATKTSADTLTASDDVVLANATTGFTLSLPTASGISGKVYLIKKVDSNWDQAITIDPNGSETIGGDTTTTLDTTDESIRIVSDGSNWQILERVIPSVWESFDASSLSTWTSGATYTAHKRRVGDSLEVVVNVAVTGTPTTAWLKLTLPDSLSIDTTKLTIGSASEALGVAKVVDPGNAEYIGLMRYNGTSTEVEVRYMLDVDTNLEQGVAVAQNAPITFASGDGVWFKFSVPVSGWN